MRWGRIELPLPSEFYSPALLLYGEEASQKAGALAAAQLEGGGESNNEHKRGLCSNQLPLWRYMAQWEASSTHSGKWGMDADEEW